MNLIRNWNFDNTYARLPNSFFSRVNPTKVTSPKTIYFNDKLASEIGIEFSTNDALEIAEIFSGNKLIENSEPIAQAYAGHQFGNFTMLGDGRAILLAEHITKNNKRIDIQLKGAGETPYSRRGDGRATLRSMLREYLISEAMHGLNIPTSRSLTIISSGDKVYRETIHDGAILTRVLSSHIRVGTFEFVRNFLSHEDLKLFTNYVINRHYPELVHSINPPLELLKAVMDKQIDLIVNWMRVGFIHGVMNTDNMSIAGETFDYGPCAFMNSYNPKTVFSSIDTNGRYSFSNQPAIAQWNLSCLGSALLPLISDDKQYAINMAQEVLDSFPNAFRLKWEQMMLQKLGFNNLVVTDELKNFIHEVLIWMQQNEADYTNTFLAFNAENNVSKQVYQKDSFKVLPNKWEVLIVNSGSSTNNANKIMIKSNPYFIPRNHLVEEALDEACNNENYEPFNTLLKLISEPYTPKTEYENLQKTPKGFDENYSTFCGT